jgi:hypothetical protein
MPQTQADQLMTLRLPPELYRWLRSESYRRGQSMHDTVVMALEGERETTETLDPIQGRQRG